MNTKKILLSVLLCLVMVAALCLGVACNRETKLDLSDATQWGPAVAEGEDDIYRVSKDADGNLVFDFAKNDTYNATKIAFAAFSLDDLAKVKTLVVTAKMTTNAPYPALLFKVEGTDEPAAAEVKVKGNEEFTTYEWDFAGYDITKVTRFLIFADPGVAGSEGKITVKEIYLTSNELNEANDANNMPPDQPGAAPAPVWNEVKADALSIGNWVDGTANKVYTATKNADGSYKIDVNKKIGAGQWDALISYIHGDALKNMKSFKIVIKGTAGKRVYIKPFDNFERKVVLTGGNDEFVFDVHTVTEKAESDFSKKDAPTAENKVCVMGLPDLFTGTDSFTIISAEFSTEAVTIVDNTVNEITADNHKITKGWEEHDTNTYKVTAEGTSFNVEYNKNTWQALEATVKGAEIANMTAVKYTIKGTAGKTIMLKPFNQNSLETTKTLTGGEDVFTVDIAGYVAGKTFDEKVVMAIIAEPGLEATGTFTIISVEFTSDVVVDETVNEITAANHKITKAWEGLDAGIYTVTADGTKLKVAYTTTGAYQFLRTFVKGAEIANMKTIVFTVKGIAGEKVLFKPFNQGRPIETEWEFTGGEDVVTIDISSYVAGKTFAEKEPVLLCAAPGVEGGKTGEFTLISVEFSATADTSIRANEYNGGLQLGFNNYWRDNGDKKWTISDSAGIWTLAYAADHRWASATTRIELGSQVMNYITVEYKVPAGQKIIIKFAEGNQIEENGTGEFVKVTRKLSANVTGTVDVLMFAAWEDEVPAGEVQIKTATLYYVSESEVKEGNLAVTATWQPADKGDDRFSIDNTKGEIEVNKVGAWDSLLIWVDLGEGGYDTLTFTFKGTAGHNATIKLNNDNALQKVYEGTLTGEDDAASINATGLKGIVEIRLFLDWNDTKGGTFTISDIVFTEAAA